MNRYLVSFYKNRKFYSTLRIIAPSTDAARQIAEHLIVTGGVIGREEDGLPPADIRAVPGVYVGVILDMGSQDSILPSGDPRDIPF